MTVRIDVDRMRVEFGVGDRDAAVREALCSGYAIVNGNGQVCPVGEFEFDPDEARKARAERKGRAVPFQVSPGVFALKIRRSVGKR